MFPHFHVLKCDPYMLCSNAYALQCHYHHTFHLHSKNLISMCPLQSEHNRLFIY